MYSFVNDRWGTASEFYVYMLCSSCNMCV
jgi:hypothetical protein